MKVSAQPPATTTLGSPLVGRASPPPPAAAPRETDAALNSVRQPGESAVSLEGALGIARNVVSMIQGDRNSAWSAHGGLDANRLMSLLA